jgi:hypothetical protein
MESIIVAHPEPTIFVSCPMIVKNISRSPCESLEIFCFSKYRICGANIHKAHFFFHWIDIKDLYEIITIFGTYSHTYIHIKISKSDILLQYISQSLIVTTFYYIHYRSSKIY